MSDPIIDEIRKSIAAINDAWLKGRFEELTPFFHADVVVAHPGFAARTEGRETLVASYADFASKAKVISLTIGDVQADRVDDTVVTTTPWEMKYEFGGQQFHEAGWDLLVFAADGERWVIVWRTVILRPVNQPIG